jgi:hypothetical protein
MGKTASLANIGTIADSSLGFRNRLINSDMRIDQRNAGASITFNDGVYPTDRWRSFTSQSNKATAQQNAGALTGANLPSGFTNYLGITSSSAYPIVSGDIFAIGQLIEGFNTADLGFGTANAKTVTLSFQVYSSLTGTFGGALQNSARSLCYPFTYSIPVANTWTTISVTVAGPTSGTWVTNNGTGLQVIFGLGVGSTYSGTAGSWGASNYFSATGATSVVGTNGATFYITGVQLEKGSTATSFDYRPYGTELALCQRYCLVYRYSEAAYMANATSFLNTTTAVAYFPFPTSTRVAPTGITVGAAGNFLGNGTNSNLTISSITFNNANLTSGRVTLTGTGGTSGQNLFLQANNSSANLEFTGMEL